MNSNIREHFYMPYSENDLRICILVLRSPRCRTIFILFSPFFFKCKLFRICYFKCNSRFVTIKFVYVCFQLWSNVWVNTAEPSSSLLCSTDIIPLEFLIHYIDILFLRFTHCFVNFVHSLDILIYYCFCCFYFFFSPFFFVKAYALIIKFSYCK